MARKDVSINLRSVGANRRRNLGEQAILAYHLLLLGIAAYMKSNRQEWVPRITTEVLTATWGHEETRLVSVTLRDRRVEVRLADGTPGSLREWSIWVRGLVAEVAKQFPVVKLIEI